jgi:DNA-binding NarL/FixJ family response regulator
MSAQYPASLVLEDESLDSGRVLIIARRDLFVGGIIRLLEASEDIATVTCVAPGEPCSRYFAGVYPDLLLLQQNAIPEPFEDFIREMVEGFPGLRMLIFGQAMPDDYLHQVVHAGAHGYINENMNDRHVSAAIGAVRDGRYWVERHIMERFIADASLIDGIHARVRSLSHRLTNREAEVLGLVMMGLSTGEIAERVFLSHQGVKAHLTTLFRKFAVRNRSQLILRALDEVTPVESISGLLSKGLQAARSANRARTSLQRQS